MSNSDVRRSIEVQAEVLGPLLFSGVSTSLTAAHTHREGLDHAKYPHLLPLLMRAELREFLEGNALPDGWVIGGDARRMGQLLLTHTELNIEMRFLKERRDTYPNGVPSAGSTTARRNAWTAERLDLAWPSSPGSSDAPADKLCLLLLWDFVAATKLMEFTLRVVHTTAPGVYGKAVPCDLILDVKVGGEIFRRLEFTGAHDDRDFFAVEVDEEGNERGS